MFKKSVPALCLFSALALTSSAAADAILLPGVTFTGRAGPATTSTIEIGEPSDLNALNTISWGESWDSPCWMRAYKAEINGAGVSTVGDFDSCTTTGPNKSVGWLNNSGIFATGLAVCTNAGSDRLKGIQLFGGTILSTGVLVPGAPPMITTRTNCNTWHAAVFCPAGEVATRLRVHHTNGEIRALSLGCRVVAPM
jgi:hypothetical protein